MKKTFIFGLMAAALVFTACSEDDLNGNNGASNSNQKGMVLRATVEQPGDTRATFTDSEKEEGTWLFDFTTDDKVSVTNTAISNFYTFTNDGTKFKSEEAETTESDETWYAYFPSNEIDLTNQSGTKADVANKYALAGATAPATTGKGGLSITMAPQVAILVINNQKGAIDISLTTAEIIDMSPMPPMTMPFKIQGLKANGAGFDLNYGTNDTKFLSKTEKGTYYIAVPAGVQFVVKDGDTAIKSTGTNGLQAGKYYNLTIFPFGQGEAKATGIGNVRWIQLWEGGPKFAEKNVENPMLQADALKTGDDYVWGANWCTPSQDDWEELRLAANTESEMVTCEYIEKGGTYGFKFTGKTEGYTSNSVFFPAPDANSEGGTVFYWWTTSNSCIRIECYFNTPNAAKTSARPTNLYLVRPVLNEN